MVQEVPTKIYSKTYTNVLLNKGNILYKVIKNHYWDAASYPSDNAVRAVSTTGYYDVKVSFDAETHTPSMTLTGPAKYQLSVASDLADAEVSAKAGSSTIGEGQSVPEVLPGTKVTVTAEPDAGKRVTGITVKYNDVTDNNTEKSVTVSGSGKTYTFEMPLGETTVQDITTEDYTVETKTVYFYNKSTQYPKVGIYVYHKTGNAVSDVVYPVGTLMTKMDNSDIWYIDNVPVDAFIQFNGDGYSTGELQPLNEPHGSKYTPGSDRTQPEIGGTWGEYIERDNVYHVSKGTTLTGPDASNLFTGINATFFDYYVDNEVTGGWLKGITDESDYKCSGSTNDPYRQYLNKALSDYAIANSTSYPLYWGNNKSEGQHQNVSSDPNNANYLYKFLQRANNSDGLNPYTTAIQGLADNTITGGTIHHSGTNGAAMAFFDEDFLSGENTKNTALATILHSNAFPVRKETFHTIYYTKSENVPSGETVLAYVWGNDGNAKVAGVPYSGGYAFSIPPGMNNVIFYHGTSTDVGPVDGNKYTGDLTINSTNPASNGSNWVASSFSNTTHTYYEYDSTGGKDNAFIQNINTTNHTADLNYYPGSTNSALAKSTEHGPGFFPFDKNNLWGGTYKPDKIYLDPGVWDTTDPDEDFYAFFMDKSVSPEVDAWSEKMTLDPTTGYYVCDVPDARYNGKNVLFVRMKKDIAPCFDDGKRYNQTDNLSMPTTKNVVCEITGWGSSKSPSQWKSDSKIDVPYIPSNTNNYAEASRTAHDQGFGMKLEIPFTLNANGLNEDGTAQTFDFSGDDDLWVFIDDMLVLDLGGAHARTIGSINFNTMIATANTASTTASSAGSVKTYNFSSIVNTADPNFKPDQMHTMTIYYMERGMFDSNLKFGFSFHAIPNQFQAEKKVRATNVNSGFFYTNGQSAADKTNMSNLFIDKGTRQVTWFEKSYQNETFRVHQKFSGSHDTIKYTFGDSIATMTAPDDIQDNTIAYLLQNNNDGDRIDYFNGQFAKEELFEVWETLDDEDIHNRYKYEPRAVIRDESKSGDAKLFESVSTLPSTASEAKGKVSGNNDSHYKFYFLPKDALVQGGIEDIRIRARFENEIKAHSLTIKKNTNTQDQNDENFTIEVMFKFGEEGYRAYPLYTDNDAKPQLDANGHITLKAGESITLNGIPETAEVRVREIYNSSSAYAYKDITVTNEDGSTLETTDVTDSTGDGVTFTMGNYNATADLNNTSGEPVYISHTKLPGTPGTGFFYVTANVKNQSNETITTYPMTSGVITVGSNHITKNSTDTLEIVIKTSPGSGYSLKEFYEGITPTITPLVAQGATIEYTSTRNNDTLEATITLPIKKLFNDKGKQLYTKLPFYSELEALRSLTITKNIPNDDSLGVLENLHTYFPVKIQISHDGTNFTDYNDPALSGTDANGDQITEVPRSNYKDTNGNWFAVHRIRQKDRIILPNLQAGWKVRVIELTAADIYDGTGDGNRGSFVTDFGSALNNYTFESVTAREEGASTDAATNATGQQYADVTVPESNDMVVTITNEAILYTVKVKKELKDNFPDDGSTFELTVSYNPTGSNTGGTYQPVTNGLVSDTITGGKTGGNGVYTVKKDSVITFNNIPKGTFFKVEETAINNSPVTNSQRFALDTMELSTGSAPTVENTARFFSVTGDDTSKELTLTVINKVKMSWTKIEKLVDPVTDGDETNHKIKISVDYNGNNAPLSTIEYRTQKDSLETPTAVSASDTISIKKGQHIWLYYPIGSTISVEEVQPGENYFQIKSITVSNVMDGSITYSKTDESLPVNNKVTFKTTDNAEAVVNITNEKTPNIKYVIVYNFPSRSHVIGENVGQPKYGNLSYTVEGSGKPADILANDKISKDLVQKKVPYEKNFMQGMNWNFDNISYPAAADDPTTDSDGVKVYHCTVNAVNTDIPTVNVTFYFPYASTGYVIRDYDSSVSTNAEKGTIYGPVGTPTNLGDYTTQSYVNQVYQSNPVVYAKRYRQVDNGNGGTTDELYDEKFCTFAADSVGGKKFA